MKSSKGIYYRNGIAYIRYQNEKGELFRESTQQADRRVAERILVKRRSQVAMLHHFPSRSFESVKFGSLLEEWWERQGKSKRSCYRYLIDAVREPFGNLRARDIRPMDIERFLDELSATGKSNAYLNVHRTVISNAFSFAIKNKLFDDNPTRAVPTRRENRRERFASPEEFRRLIAGSSEDPELEAFIYLAAMTAMRKSEILERRWDEVFLNAELPYLRVPITKNGDPKSVPIPDAVVESLKRLPSYGKAEHLFPATPTNRQPGNFKKAHRWDLGKKFRRLCEKLGIEDLRIHDLRHTGPTVLLAAGVPETVVSKLTGHRSHEVRNYQHLSPRLRQQTVDLIAQVLTEAGEIELTDTVALSATPSRKCRSGKSLKKKGKSGGLEATRTPDLYRVKVAL